MRSTRVYAALALVGLLTALPAPTAYAHTEALAGSNPAAGSVVKTAEALELRFVDRIQVESATFTLRSAKGEDHAVSGPTWTRDDQVATLRPASTLPDGRYRVGYQVIFTDGDPAVGVVEFEVSADGVARAPAWPSGDPPPEVLKERFAAGAAVPWMVGAAVLGLAGLTLALLRVRRRERAG